MPCSLETLLWRSLCFCGSGHSWATQSPCISHAPEAVVPSSFNPAETGCLMELHSSLHFLPHLTSAFSLSNWTLFRELMFPVCVSAKDMLLAMSENEFSGNGLKMKLRSPDRYAAVPLIFMNSTTSFRVCKWKSTLGFIYFHSKSNWNVFFFCQFKKITANRKNNNSEYKMSSVISE